MRKKVLVSLIILTVSATLYWYYLAPPSAFPDKEEIKNILMNPYNELHVEEIQDIIFLDDRHVYIPFTTKTESHGISFWEWKKHEWELSSFSSGSMPQIWKIDSDDPATHFIMWNFHPENNLDSLTFYLIKERGYTITEGKQQYDPGIQMDFRAEFGEHSYGYSLIPSEWQTYMEAENKLLKEKNPEPLFADYFPPAQYYFGWQTTNKDGKIEFPSFPDRNGFGSGGPSAETLRFLNEHELY